MREIKFRAWDTDAKKWCGYEDTGHIINLQHSITNNCFMVDNDKYDFPSELELSQYTGLKDKNGVEIYEGDVVRFDSNGYGDGRVVCVEWDEELTGYKPFSEQILCAADSYSEWSITSKEVIGNIHENPELLK